MNVEVASEIIRSYYAAYPAHGRSVDDVLTGRTRAVSTSARRRPRNPRELGAIGRNLLAATGAPPVRFLCRPGRWRGHERLQPPDHRRVPCERGQGGRAVRGSGHPLAPYERREERRAPGQPRGVPAGRRRPRDRRQQGRRADEPRLVHNLRANPVATVEVGTDQFEVKARITGDVERERLWTNTKRELPSFAEYERKTDREIPVIVLERVA
jgi:deazaflavin-dependent oxidoreductase (nitroreductase family)